MAKTKFLDYTGLAKLVEKIKNTYVNKNEQYEANLKWGGRNFNSSWSPIDGAMISELGANRFAFAGPKGIIVEYSNDGGSTWKKYGDEMNEKALFSRNAYIYAGGNINNFSKQNMLRITIDTTYENGINCYTRLNKFCIKFITNGVRDCYCTIQKAKQKSPSVYINVIENVELTGWPSYNIINIQDLITSGHIDNSQHDEYYCKIRFIFGATGPNDNNNRNFCVQNIKAFGGDADQVPSNIAKDGHLYDYDYAQNATFPANITATNFIGTLQGNANSASKLGTATVGSATKPMYLNGGTPTECTYTLAQNVTSASKLTDTTYSASTGLSLSKDNKFSINAATSSTIGGVKIGSGITVDTGGTISLTKTNVTNALGYTPPKADTNTTYTFTSGTGGTFTVKASNSDSGQTISVGVPAKASAATSAETAATAATAATAEKVGSETVGSATKPIYLNGGTPTACTYTLAQSVTSTSKLTDHLYNAGEGLKLTTGTTADTFSLSAATSSTIGGVKIGNNISITSGTISLTKANVTTALGYTPPTADTNTHYTTGLIVGNSSSSTGNTAVTTNGVFLNLKDDNHIRNSHKIVGGGATTVTSDSDGTITIHSTDKKVYQEVDTTTIGSTPLLLSPLSEDTKMGETYFTTSAKINFNIVAVPKSGTLKATHFIGTTFSGDTFSGTTFTGNAATATRLSTSTAGGETQPVYFDGGIPKPLKYTIGKSVPSTAVFTDTKYTLSGDGTNKVTITDSNKSQQSITINNVQSAITATYANQYLYNNSPRDFVYDAADNQSHNIRCQDDTIIVANRINLNKYEFIINADGTGRFCIYDDGNSMGTFWGVDGMVFEKAPANSLVAANGTFATAISDTDIKNAINSAIDWTQSL